MTIKEILSLEKGNDHFVFLLKNGLFWRAYNCSAYLVEKYIRAFKVTKRHYKVVQQEVVYLGFPDSILTKVIQGSVSAFSIIEQSDRQIKLKLNDESLKINRESYDDWFKRLASVNVLEQSVPEEKAVCEGLIRAIRTFPILEKSPIESQLFIMNLQKQVNGTV